MIPWNPRATHNLSCFIDEKKHQFKENQEKRKGKREKKLYALTFIYNYSNLIPSQPDSP